MLQTWKDNPWYQRMVAIERNSGLEMGLDDIRQCMQYPAPVECQSCHEQTSWWKPTVGRYVCPCGHVNH